MPSSRTGFLAIGLAAGLIASGAVAAIAAIPDRSTGQITACYAKSDGAVRLIDLAKGQKCKTTESKVAWSQRGPAGPRGATGDTGVVDILFGTEFDKERMIGTYDRDNLTTGVTRFATTQSFVAGRNQEVIVTGTVSAIAPAPLAIIGFPMFSENNGSTWFNCGGGGIQSVSEATLVGAAFQLTGHCALALTPGTTYRFAMGVAIFQGPITSFIDTAYQNAYVTATVVSAGEGRSRATETAIPMLPAPLG